MTTEITKYSQRNWAVWLIGGAGDEKKELIAVTVYKRGAESVQAVTDALIKVRNISGRRINKAA